MESERITREHVESRLRLVQDELQGKVRSKQSLIKTGLTVGAGLVVLIAYLLGKRSGRGRRGARRN
jgi:hypothetical protein